MSTQTAAATEKMIFRRAKRAARKTCCSDAGEQHDATLVLRALHFESINAARVV